MWVVKVHVRGSTVVCLRRLQPSTVTNPTRPRNDGRTIALASGVHGAAHVQHGQRATGGFHRRLPAGAHDHPVRAQQIEPYARLPRPGSRTARCARDR